MIVCHCSKQSEHERMHRVDTLLEAVAHLNLQQKKERPFRDSRKVAQEIKVIFDYGARIRFVNP